MPDPIEVQKLSTVLFPIFVKSSRESEHLRAGFINESGAVIVEPMFDCAGPLREGFAPVQIEKRWGFIDSSGHLRIAPFSGGKADFYGGRAVFTDPLTSLCGVIDMSGQVVVEPCYFRVGRFDEGVAWMSNKGAWNSTPGSYGILSEDGTVKVPFYFDDMRNFREGFAAAELEGKWGFVTPEGDFQIPAQFDAATCFSEGLARVKTGELWGFIDTEGRDVIEPIYAAALDFSEGLAAVQLNSLWGFINRKGESVIPHSWSRVGSFSGGLAQVQVNGKMGYIDRGGIQVIASRFEMAQDFRFGRSLVETTKEIGYIDVTGEFVWRGPYLDVSFAYL